MASLIKFTYHTRLFLGLVLYSVLMMACVLVFQYRREKAFKAEELNAQLQGINGELLSHIDDTTPTPFDSVGLAIATKSSPEMRISVITLSGEVVYDNSLDTLPNTNHIKRKEIAQAMTDGQGYTFRRHSESTGQTYFYSAKRGDKYLIRTAVPYSVTLQELLSADYGFIWFMVGLTAVMCLIGFFATRRIGQSMRRLREFARKAERGERIFGTPPFPNDELGDISTDIVRLYGKLQHAVAERDREHSNALQRQQEKELIKKELTNNINHELKTPVASIQACLETVLTHENLQPEKRKEFLQRAMNATARLKQLLYDVAVLTRLDEAPSAVGREKIDLAAVIDRVAEESANRAESKGMEIKVDLPRPIMFVGNEALLDSVFQNLIDNAINYSGGTEISISASFTSGGALSVIVEDDGRGVGEEHLQRLFERFYRIDKGRSRASGGTGLGLAIVKNAVLLHRGTISVANRSTGGLRFTIHFP